MVRAVQRKKLSWVTHWQASTASGLTIAVDGTLSTKLHVLVSEAEVEDHDDELTVLRIVGEFHQFWHGTPTAVNRPMVCMAGILVRESSDLGVTPSMMIPAHIEEYPWMWLRSWAVLPDAVSKQSATACVDASTPGTALEKVDIRVKRKLRSGDELYFYAQCQFVGYTGNALPANATLDWDSWLRVRILIES